MAESIQKRLLRVRPPRVKITYDVETLGSSVATELAFLVAILADLSGAGEKDDVEARKFVEIDRDNFNEVLKKSAPRTPLTDIKLIQAVDDEFDDDQEGLRSILEDLKDKAKLPFESIDDFEPRKVIENVEQLGAIFRKREELRDLQTRIEVIPDVQSRLEKVLAQKIAPADPPPEGDTEGSEEFNKTNDLLTALESFNDEASIDSAHENAAIEEFAKGMRFTTDDDPAETVEKEKTYLARLLGRYARDILVRAVEKGTEAEGAKAEELANKGMFAYFDLRISHIDEILSKQLSLILHDARFQKLEATWRGMHYLVFRAETGEFLKLRVLNINKNELRTNLMKAVEFDQSFLFKHIYEAEYGTYGGSPYSLIVGDYEFDRSNPDITLLDKIAELAASAHAPFIAAAYANLFNLKTFEDLSKPRDLAKIFDGVELNRWRSFRDSEDSRYVSLTLPKVLLRLPYGGEKGEPVEAFDFKEAVDGASGDGFLWGNPAYVLADRITNAFSLYKWPAAIRGVEGGGLVEGLPSYTYKSGDGDDMMVCPTQVTITDRREKELNDLGFVAICHRKGSDKAAFFGGQTTNKPKKYLNDKATANAALSSRLPYILCASRFAHYIKVIMREKIGKFATRGNVEEYLNSWIAQYVLLDDDATQDMKAAYPLRAAAIQVTEIAGNPGAYNATVFIKPHFQLEELTASIRLVAEIPA